MSLPLQWICWEKKTTTKPKETKTKTKTNQPSKKVPQIRFLKIMIQSVISCKKNECMHVWACGSRIYIHTSLTSKFLFSWSPTIPYISSTGNKGSSDGSIVTCSNLTKQVTQQRNC